MWFQIIYQKSYQFLYYLQNDEDESSDTDLEFNDKNSKYKQLI